MSGEPENPIRRWSERKAKAREEAEAVDLAEAAEQASLPEAPAEGDETVPEVTAEQLPDIDGLDKDSDYSVFMVKGVPEHLKRLALRKLWLSDPVLANLDGLVDYGEDFTVSTLMGDAVKTIYKVGKGLIDEDEELDDVEDEEPADGEAGSETDQPETDQPETDQPETDQPEIAESSPGPDDEPAEKG